MIRQSGKAKWGFIDKSGKMIIEPQFNGIWPLTGGFDNGLAYVEVDEQWGYINKKGDYILEPTK